MKLMPKFFCSILLFAIFFSACKTRKTISNFQSKQASHDKEINASFKKIQQKYAPLLNVKETDIKNQKLYFFIDDWYGTPYKYAGKDKSGIDCSGLINILMNVVYAKKTASSTKLLFEESVKINRADLKEGDLVFFKIDSNKASHVGLYLQHDKFFHASTKKGAMISDLNEPYFKKCFLSAAKVK